MTKKITIHTEANNPYERAKFGEYAEIISALVELKPGNWLVIGDLDNPQDANKIRSVACNHPASSESARSIGCKLKSQRIRKGDKFELWITKQKEEHWEIQEKENNEEGD